MINPEKHKAVDNEFKRLRNFVAAMETNVATGVATDEDVDKYMSLLQHLNGSLEPKPVAAPKPDRGVIPMDAVIPGHNLMGHIKPEQGNPERGVPHTPSHPQDSQARQDKK